MNQRAASTTTNFCASQKATASERRQVARLSLFERWTCRRTTTRDLALHCHDMPVCRDSEVFAITLHFKTEIALDIELPAGQGTSLACTGLQHCTVVGR